MRVPPGDECRTGAEIAPQLQRPKSDVADSMIARLQEQADFGFSKPVDRLHRIADHEQRAAIATLPACSEGPQQRELLVRSILEFVHQNMTQRSARAQCEITGRTLLTQRLARRGGDVAVIDPGTG